MSTPSTPLTGTPVTVAPQKLNAIQIIEQEIGNFIKQREQAVANVHAIEGAIQAAQHLLGRLKQEAARAEAAVAGEVEKVVEFVKKEL